MSNPTSGADKSDAAGRFPQIFAAEGAIFDVLEKDSGGSTIATYLNVVSLGSNTGALSRDFTTSRFQARGAGGTTYVEAGDPTGDDVGGTMQIGGWNGTAADLITLAATLVNVTGRLKENSKKLPGTVYAENQTFSTVASVIIPLTADPAGVRGFHIDVADLMFSATVPNLNAVFSYDNGATYKTGSTDYEGLVFIVGAGTTSVGANTAGSLALVIGGHSPANKPAKISIDIICPDSGLDHTVIESRFTGYDNTGTPIPLSQQGANFGKGGYGRPTHMKLVPSSGNISGQWRLIPQRGFGET